MSYRKTPDPRVEALAIALAALRDIAGSTDAKPSGDVYRGARWRRARAEGALFAIDALTGVRAKRLIS